MKKLYKVSIATFLLSAFLHSSNAQTVSDIDGNVYNTVTIGSQVWMQENLKTTHFRNDSAITEIEDSLTWSNVYDDGSEISDWCYFNSNAINNFNYGKLYNWFAVTNSNNICPTGWHVPSDSEWHTLVLTIDPGAVWTFPESATAGGAMKAPTLWRLPNTGADNSSGFSAFPGGERDYWAYFWNLGDNGSFWSSSEVDDGHAWLRTMAYNNTNVMRNQREKEYGYSVRCLRDLLTSLPGENRLDKPIQIYPNPAKDRIYIDCFENRDVHAQVYNILGQCVLQILLGNGKHEIEISNLSAGTYVIHLTGANWTGQGKFSKE